MESLGRAFALAALLCTLAGAPALAQQMWVQIAARPSQPQAEEMAADYAQRIDDVAGFRLGASDFYAIAIGPYPPDEAAARRSELVSAGLIPGDAFATSGARFRDQFWPVAAPEGVDDTASDDTADPGEAAEPRASGQTPQEARRAEQSLSPQDRRDVQMALAWGGFYEAAIDGAFGPGTRAAMSRWQRARGYEATGVLTVAQREALVGEYRDTLADLGLETVRDEAAGIELRMPAGRVSFQDHAPPFARYGGDGPAQVLLISQRGDRAMLTGLYEVMQTLEIVPPEGQRRLDGEGFTLIGRNDDLVSHSEARLADGVIKGFTLVWPASDEAVRERLVAEMRASFTRLDGAVLDDAEAEGGVDLLAGLEIRRPLRTRSGFYVAPDGRAVTTADAVDGCGRVTMDDGAARVTATDGGLGLALLSPEAALAPRAHAGLSGIAPRRGAEATLAGFSFGRALAMPSLTQGRLADLGGLDGNAALHRFDLDTRESDAGGPILDRTGGVMGALLPEGARALPEGVALAVNAEAIGDFLERNDAAADAIPGGTDPLSSGAMERHAADLAVRVECWE